MIRNYVITALRALVRNRVTSVINIGGLAAGIAASILIMLYVFSELSVDKFNDNYDRIYRLEVGDFFISGTAQALILKEAFPEVAQTVRLDYRHNPVARYMEENFRFEHFFYADSTLFDVFTFEFISGDPVTALQLPYSMVLTESEALKIFGNENPVGRILTVNKEYEFTVRAVIKDISDFHLPLSAIGSFSSLPHIYNDEDHDRHLFSYMNFLTYVLFHDNVDPIATAEKFDRLIDERFPEARSYPFRFRPLKDIYFNREIDDSPPVRHGNLPLIYTLIAVAGFIWCIAIINFINLSTANASARSGEIGVRKIMGAQPGNLIIQFLAESVGISIFAFLLGVVIVEILLPVFNNLLSTNLSFNPFSSPVLFVSLMMLVLITGVLAGLYPAFYLSSMKSQAIVKGSVQRSSGALQFRRALIIFQFTVSIALIIGTLLVQEQADYMRSKNLGFDKKNIITIRLNREVIGAYDVFHDNIAAHDAIESVSISNSMPGYITWFETWYINGERKTYKFLPVDPYYIDLMGIEIKKGRNFDFNRRSDQENTFILNEAAVRYFGFEDPVGKELMVGGKDPVRIIGIVKDFHFRSLHEPIGPLLMGWRPRSLGLANIRIDPYRKQEAVNHIREQWEIISPGSFLEFRFLDDEIDKLYQAEIRMGKLFRYFSVLAVVIACMGLYGLGKFVASQRTKEIGIRKVLGANIWQISLMLVSEFAIWVFVANIIAWPVAYMVTAGWLDNFPYRVEQSVIIYVSAGLIALIIAIITVGGQAWRTANMNPAYTLRNE